MPLEADYLAALELLGRVCEDYRRETGDTAFLVSGAAVAIWTGGVFHWGADTKVHFTYGQTRARKELIEQDFAM